MQLLLQHCVHVSFVWNNRCLWFGALLLFPSVLKPTTRLLPAISFLRAFYWIIVSLKGRLSLPFFIPCKSAFQCTCFCPNSSFLRLFLSLTVNTLTKPFWCLIHLAAFFGTASMLWRPCTGIAHSWAINLCPIWLFCRQPIKCNLIAPFLIFGFQSFGLTRFLWSCSNFLFTCDSYCQTYSVLLAHKTYPVCWSKAILCMYIVITPSTCP